MGLEVGRRLVSEKSRKLLEWFGYEASRACNVISLWNELDPGSVFSCLCDLADLPSPNLCFICKVRELMPASCDDIWNKLNK